MSRVTCVHRIRQPGAVVSQVALDAATGVAAVSQVELDAAGVAVSRVALNQNKYGMVRSSPPPGELFFTRIPYVFPIGDLKIRRSAGRLTKDPFVFPLKGPQSLSSR